MRTARRCWQVALGRLALALGLASAGEPAPKVPLTPAELVPKPVPEGENAAELYLTAMGELEAEPVWDTDLATLADHASQGDLANLGDVAKGIHIPQKGGQEALLGDVLDEFARQLDGPVGKKVCGLIEQASNRPNCRFDLDYSRGPDIQLPHLAKLRGLARFLAAASFVREEQRETDAAWICVRQQLQLADHLRGEPLLISQLVRVAIYDCAETGLRRLATSGPVPAKLAPAIDRLLGRMDDPQPWVGAMHGERLLLGEWVFNLPPQELAKTLAMLSAPKRTPLPAPEQIAVQRAAYRQAMLRVAELMAQPYCQARVPLHQALAELSEPGKRNLIQPLIPALEVCARKLGELQAMVRVTRLGLRLIAYRTAHGGYPPDLAALALGDIPPDRRIDPFTGRSLVYRRQGKGFILYSLGPDAKDNAGRARHGRQESGYDIVWSSAQ